MFKKITLLTMLLMLSVGAFAQRKAIPQMWDKPEPVASALAEGDRYYLYNVAAEGFYTGANDWETRASFNATDGYCVNVVKALNADETWDGKSYQITYTIKTGGDAGKEGTMKILGYESIWIDEVLGGTDDQYIIFEAQGDNDYRIGLSPLNTTYTDEGVYLGIKKGQHNDTRLYFLDTEVEDYTDYEPNIRWRLVSESGFEAYVEALQAYKAAKQLHDALVYAEATFPDLDITDETAVFSNIGTDAGKYMDALESLTNKMVTRADVDHPADLTFLILADGTVNLDYANDNNDQWEGDAPGFQSCQGAEFYSMNYDAHRTIPHSVGQGFYQISVDAFYRSGWANDDANEWEKLQNGEEAAQNAMLYATSSAGTSTAPLPLAHDGVTNAVIGDDRSTTTFGYIPNNMWTASLYFNQGLYKHPATVMVYAEDEEAFTFGVKKEIWRDADWTFLHGWHIAYLGDRDDAAQQLRDQHLAAYPDYVEMQANGDLQYYSPDLFETYSQAYNALKEATNKEDIMAAIPDFDTQAELMKANVDAYAAFVQKMTDAENFYIEHEASFVGEGMELLGTYVFDEEEPSTELPYPNGTGLYIMNNGTLSTADIITETEYLQTLIDDAMKGGMADGTDCTELIKNPHFTEEGIWSKQGFPEWPLGPDSYKLAQGFSILFDTWQELTGLQDGLYEVNINGLFRPANYGSVDYGNEPQAFLYMNGFKKHLNTIESGATATNENGHSYNIVDVGYVPNTVDEAAASFAAGNYPLTLYGLVTDGTMKIGVRNDLRYEGCWAVWSDFHLTFRAKNPEVLAEVIDMTIPDAQDILGNHFGVSESNALDQAIITAQDTEGEARYDAMVTLKNAMDAAQECIDTYKKLSDALSNLQTAINETPTSSHLEEANSLLADAQDAYNNGTYDNAEAQDMIAQLGEMVATVRFGDNTEEEVDMSDLIVNRNFDPKRGSKDTQTIEGWTTSPMNGYKEYSVSYNKAIIDLKQTITVPKKGKYRVTVHTYYRAGYYNEEIQHIANGEDTHLTTLYAQTPDKKFETPVMNLVEDAQTETYDVNCYDYGDGRHAPDGTKPTVAWFAQGRYLNELEFTVGEDNTSVTIGLKKDEIIQNDYEVVGEWNLYYLGEEKEVREDYSSLIVNNKFDPKRGNKAETRIDGWVTTALNGYKEWTCSYNKTAFHLYQDITVPKGNYELTVHTYYRAGYYDEEIQHIANGEDTHLTTLYAETPEKRYETLVMNLVEDAQTETYGVNCYDYGDGRHAPDGTTPTAAWFAQGRYLNKLNFTAHEDNCKVRIGLKKDETFQNDYEVVGEWNLYFLGTSTGIDDITAADANVKPVEFYSLSGARLNAPQRGINLIKMSDGTVRKVFVK